MDWSSSRASSSGSSISSASILASRKIASAGATRSRSRRAQVLVGQLVLVDVEDVEERLGGEQVQLAQRRRGPSAAPAKSVVPLVRGASAPRCGLDDGELVLVLLGPRLLLQARQRLLDRLEVGEDQLGVDRLDVARRGDLAVDVGDVRIVEDADDLADRVGLADVGQELVAQALPLGGAPHDARRCRRTRMVAGTIFGEPKISASSSQARVGHADHADVGLDRRERVVRRQRVVLGQRVEQGGLADVRQPDDSDGEAHGRQSLWWRRTPRAARIGRGPRVARLSGGAWPSRRVAAAVRRLALSR